MGAIYSAAALTLIASAGNDPNYGLPGVTIERPSLGAFEHVGATTLMLQPNAGVDEIYHSSWTSRAWTYQEGYLSRRRLFLTEGQAVYICNDAINHETRIQGQDCSRKSPGLLRGSVPSISMEKSYFDVK